MIEPFKIRRLTGQFLYVLLILAIMFWRILPLTPGQVSWPGPDLALCLTFAWVLRRPDQVPVLLIAIVFMIEDIVFLRPLGLWTAMVVLGTEAARKRGHRWGELSFVVEWLRVAILMVLMTLTYRVILTLFFLSTPPFGQVMLQLLGTIAAYPIVVLLARWPLRKQRIPLSDTEL